MCLAQPALPAANVRCKNAGTIIAFVCVSYRLICQCVIRVGCYENYTRNTQTALVCTLLPVSYMLRCACWTSVCTKLCRRGQDVEHHRRARCDGSSAPCSGGPQISPHSCAAGAEGPLILAGQNRDFPRGKVAPCGKPASRSGRYAFSGVNFADKKLSVL